MSALYHLQNVCYSYGEKQVLNIEQLEIRRGAVTALLGSNGAGKSTLLKLLAFLESPQKGAMIFKGDPVSANALLPYRRVVGLVAQKPYLLKGTVFDNVALGLRFRAVSPEVARRQIPEALEMAGMSALADRSADALSGGEAQKVALARALVLQPEVLLLDEPFTHLDQNSIEELNALISHFVNRDGRSVIFTTHDRLHASALADEVMGLVSGRVIYAPLLNLFRGEVVKGSFETERISINLPSDIQSGRQVAIDPKEIVLSRQPLTSSMRNSFQGRIVMTAEEKGRVRVTVEAGERFHVQITHESLRELGLSLGEQAWVNFKSTSLRVL